MSFPLVTVRRAALPPQGESGGASEKEIHNQGSGVLETRVPVSREKFEKERACKDGHWLSEGRGLKRSSRCSSSQ